MASFHRQHWVCRFLLSLFCPCLLNRRQVTAWSPLRRIYRALQARRIHNVVTFPPDTNATTIHNYFMEIALQQAQKADRIGEVPIGAIVVRPMPNSPSTRYQVLSLAANQVETTHDASAHAELLAMRQASSRIRNWRLLNTTLYSTTGTLSNVFGSMPEFSSPSNCVWSTGLEIGSHRDSYAATGSTSSIS